MIASPLFAKALYVERFISGLTGTKFHGASQVLANDAIIYCFVAVVFYGSFLPRMSSRLVSAFLRAVGLAVLGVYVADLLVITNFNTHLVAHDVAKYVSYAPKYIGQISSGSQLVLIGVAAAGLLLVGLVSLFTRFKVSSKPGHWFFSVSILVLLLTSSCASHNQYVHSWLYENVVSYNLTVFSESKDYSKEFTSNFEFDEQMSCEPVALEAPNIVLLMVESLSSYQSEFFSGIKNWTPNIDRIAQSSVAYKNFYANGFTTEDGEVSLLTGQLPIYSPSSYTDGGGTSFNGFYGLAESLPNLLKERGYTSEFLTTADLQFAGTGDWARSIGFDYVEGHEHSYYDNWERFRFKAAPDEALYHRVLDRIDRNRDRPSFVFVKTVSTHHPFRNPETKLKSEPETFKYADRQIGTFYETLLEHDFFAQGVLIIVGDHRAMVPLKPSEISVFGLRRAAARVPLIVSYGGAKQSVESDQYQQLDVYNGLRALASGQVCHSDWLGDIFSDGARVPKYIAHRRGDNRDFISVFSDLDEYLIKLNGDDTSMVDSAETDPKVRDAIVAKVNHTRISRGSDLAGAAQDTN